MRRHVQRRLSSSPHPLPQTTNAAKISIRLIDLTSGSPKTRQRPCPKTLARTHTPHPRPLRPSPHPTRRSPPPAPRSAPQNAPESLHTPAPPAPAAPRSPPHPSGPRSPTPAETHPTIAQRSRCPPVPAPPLQPPPAPHSPPPRPPPAPPPRSPARWRSTIVPGDPAWDRRSSEMASSASAARPRPPSAPSGRDRRARRRRLAPRCASAHRWRLRSDCPPARFRPSPRRTTSGSQPPPAARSGAAHPAIARS